jgi:hypothetical protein
MNNKQLADFLIKQAQKAIINNDRRQALMIYQKINTSYLCYLRIVINRKQRKVLNMLCTMIDLEFYKKKYL